ncbi:MAG: cytochrome c biogenesis protein ResB [Dehalococcoidia bacterium]
MARAEAPQRAGLRFGWRGVDPLLPIWRLLTSVRFALALLGFLAVAGLLSIVLPQVPAPMRGNEAAISAWLEVQKGTFGPFTEPFYRLGLFNVFSARWFLGGLAVLVISVCVCTANRFAPTWRNVTRPQERVPDGFFDRAATNRASLPAVENGADRLEATLRARRFRVKRFEEAGATYLFADRFAWAQLATFVSHLALIMFLAGGLISRVGGYTNALFVAEGTTSPIFAVSHPSQMQVEVVDAVGKFDAAGTPLDYRTELVIYQGGREVARGVTTVNSPMSYGGYRFHQAGYFGEGAGLRVQDASTGNTVYHEVLALEQLVPAAAIQVRDSQGRLLLDDVIVPTDFIDDASGTVITVPGDGSQFWVGLRPDAEQETWQMLVYPPDDVKASTLVPAGGTRSVAGLSFTFLEPTGLPSLSAPGLADDPDQSLVVMSQTPEGTPYLTALGPVDGQALTLYPEQPVEIEGRIYTFEGRREFAGVEVRRDPGVNFIWVAAGLLLAGLMVTFYVPRLRLWARVRGGETSLAGLAEKSGAFQGEARQLAEALGTQVVSEEGEGKDA